MSIITIDNMGIVSVEYDAGTPLPNESHILQAPDASFWTLLANGGTGSLTVTSGASGPADALILISPNGIQWLMQVSDIGILSVTSFEGGAVVAPIVNDQVVIDGVPAVGYRLFAFEAGTNIPITIYKNGAFVEEQVQPIIYNAYGFPTDPVYINIGAQYKFVLYPPTGPSFAEWDYVSAGVPANILSPTEFVTPTIAASYVSSDTFAVQGDQRASFRSGRRVELVGSLAMYGTIFSSTYDGTETTVTVFLDGGALDATLQTAAYGLIPPSGSVFPSRRVIGIKTIFNGNLTIFPAAGLNLLPVSMVMQHITPPPAGWLECNGAAISRTTYAELFASIGTTYGVGNGTTTFNIPTIAVTTNPLLHMIYAKV